MIADCEERRDNDAKMMKHWTDGLAVVLCARGIGRLDVWLAGRANG